MNKINRSKITVLISIFIIVVIIGIFFYGTKSKVPVPQEGLLDLTGWSLLEGQPSMVGDWEFYDQQLLTKADFQNGKARGCQLVHIPDTWNDYEKEGKKFGGYGYGTYRLKVRVLDTKQKLSIRMDNASTSYRMWIDDQEIATNGKIGTDAASSKPEYKPMVRSFYPLGNEFDIIIQVSNFVYARGGLWYTIYLGLPEQIEAMTSMIIYKDAFLIGGLFIMALYYGTFYFALHRDQSSFYFMLLCLVFILRTSLYGDMVIKKLIPLISFNVMVFLTYFTLFWIPILIVLLVNTIFEGIRNKRVKKLAISYGVGMTTFIIITPVSLYTKFIVPIEFIGISMVVYALIKVMYVYLINQKWAGLILATVFFILLTGIHDVLYQSNIINDSRGELTSFGIFLFLFAFSVIIAGRLSDAFEQSRILSERLSDTLEKEKKASAELLAAELSFLKAQIRPHFIHNALSSVSALIMREPKKAKELLCDLSDYLRGSFQYEHINGLYPINKELETVKAYLAIEKARFNNRINIIYDINEDIKIMIPILTIQPIVENAVRHGILRQPQMKTIVIRVFQQEDYAVIQVEDDGMGMERMKAESLLQGESSGSGVGIKNVNSRLKLLCNSYLEIDSEIDKGTLVTFRIKGNSKTW